MSRLVFDVSEFSKNDNTRENRQNVLQQYRIFAQFIDIEYVPSGSSSKYFSKLLIRNLSIFGSNGSLHTENYKPILENHKSFHLYMEENTFVQLFINEETKINLQPGDPVDIQAVTWYDYDEDDTVILESINLQPITIKEIDALKAFILSPEGRYFFDL